MDALSRMLYFLSYYEQNTTNYRSLVILLENFKRIPDLNILEAADLCYVSTATISRLVQDMDFASYASFREEVASVLAERSACARADVTEEPLSPEQLSSSAHGYLDSIVSRLLPFLQPTHCQSLLNLAQALKKAKSVCFLISTTQAFLSLQRMLFLDGKRTTLHKVYEEAVPFANKLQKDDIFFTSINNAGECRLKFPLLEKLRSRGVLVAVMTDMEYDWPQISDYLLPCFDLYDDASILLYGVYSQLLHEAYTAQP